MQEFIVSETTKIFKKAIKNYSKKDRVEENMVSILLSLNEQGNVRYRICHHFVPVKEVTIMDILGVKIDLKGYSFLVPPQIEKILEGFEKETGSKNVEAGVYLNPEYDEYDENSQEIKYFLFKDGKKVREFQLEQVLKFEMPKV